MTYIILCVSRIVPVVDLLTLAAAFLVDAGRDPAVITNEAHDDYASDYENDGDDVVKAADAAADRMCALFTRMIESL